MVYIHGRKKHVVRAGNCKAEELSAVCKRIAERGIEAVEDVGTGSGVSDRTVGMARTEPRDALVSRDMPSETESG